MVLYVGVKPLRSTLMLPHRAPFIYILPARAQSSFCRGSNFFLHLKKISTLRLICSLFIVLVETSGSCFFAARVQRSDSACRLTSEAQTIHNTRRHFLQQAVPPPPRLWVIRRFRRRRRSEAGSVQEVRPLRLQDGQTDGGWRDLDWVFFTFLPIQEGPRTAS